MMIINNKTTTKYMGLTLLETIMSLVIISVVVLVVLGSFAFIFKNFMNGINTLKVSELAESTMEQVGFYASSDPNFPQSPGWTAFPPPNEKFAYSYLINLKQYTFFPSAPSPAIDTRQTIPKYQYSTIDIGKSILVSVKGPLNNMQDTPYTKYAYLTTMVVLNDQATAPLKNIDNKFIKMPFLKYNFDEKK